MGDREIFQELEKAAPDLGVKLDKGRVQLKNEWWLFNAINWLLGLFMGKDRFNNSFWTTIPKGLIRPKVIIAAPIRYKLGELRAWWTLAHEYGHAQQARKVTPQVFNFLYLWPISQGLLLLLTCWLPVFWASGWHLAIWIPAWAIVAGLHFIPQLPDPFRAKWEHECYTMSMLFQYWRYGQISDRYIERLVGLFSDMSYFKMQPNAGKIRKKLQQDRIRIIRGDHPIIKHPVVMYVAKLRREHGRG